MCILENRRIVGQGQILPWCKAAASTATKSCTHAFGAFHSSHPCWYAQLWAHQDHCSPIMEWPFPTYLGPPTHWGETNPKGASAAEPAVQVPLQTGCCSRLWLAAAHMAVLYLRGGGGAGGGLFSFCAVRAVFWAQTEGKLASCPSHLPSVARRVRDSKAVIREHVYGIFVKLLDHIRHDLITSLKLMWSLDVLRSNLGGIYFLQLGGGGTCLACESFQN